MALLTHKNKENFCVAYIQHKCDRHFWTEIMEDAGYKPSRTYFTRLMSQPEIQGRILEIQQEAADRAVMTLTERLVLLSDLAKDEKESTAQRIAALREIHRQSGDDVAQVSGDATNSRDMTNVVRFVNLRLPSQKPPDKSQEVNHKEIAKDASNMYLSADGKIVDNADTKLATELNKLDEMF